MPITDRAIAAFQTSVQAAVQAALQSAAAVPLGALVTTVPCGVDDFDYEIARSSPPFTASGPGALVRTLIVDREPMVDVRHTLIATDGVMSSHVGVGTPVSSLVEQAVRRQVHDAIDVLLDDKVLTVVLSAEFVAARAAALGGGRAAALLWFHHPVAAIVNAGADVGVASIDLSAAYDAADIPVYGELQLTALLVEHEGPAVFRYESRPLEATVWRTTSIDQALLSIDERRGLRRATAVTVVPFVATQ